MPVLVSKSHLNDLIEAHSFVCSNQPRKEIIRSVVENNEAMVSSCGALASWTTQNSTGRSPKDTVVVKRAETQHNIDWNSPNNIPIDEESFDMLFEDACNYLKKSDKIYVTDRVIGSDSRYALPVKTVTNHALTALFTDNMFRAVQDGIQNSVFADKEFQLVTVPYQRINQEKYHGRLRKLPNGKCSDMIVAMDFDRCRGVIIGSSYLGSVKKMLFTVANYLLPFEGVLPLHCSANEGGNGDSALLLGLSGTGKTTLSADPERLLLGDDEHGWCEDGIFNFENGCYAKMIDISAEKEPEIYNAALHNDNYLNHGAIIENAMIYPNGEFDFNDSRLTANSRSSYPLSFLKNIKESSTAGNPSTILFLTADAYGVLPPVSKLDKNQAMLWFLMGYTSKLAGTETGVTEPITTFSRFFGQPFMPSNPDVYANMLGKKMDKHNTRVYLVNTGWSGGVYGVGKRINLKYTRAMVQAAISGKLESVEYVDNNMFHVSIPKSCPGVPGEILDPINTWEDKGSFEKVASKLAKEFSYAFDEFFGNNDIDLDIIRQCPGK